MSKQSVNLLEGDIKSGLLHFALPLFLGQVFQQMYNMVDALVVGNLCGENALAAVTSTGSLIFLIVGFFGGVYGGVGVVIARCFGAGDEYQVKRAVGTAVLGTILSGLFLTLLGYFGSPVMLGWMGTPPEVMEDAVAYLGIYFLGILFVVLYNSAVGIFQAIGDSKRPLYYLIISSMVNVVLDLLFIGALGMGVGSAAAATAISQFVSFTLCFYRLLHSDRDYRVNLRKLGFDMPALRAILANGVPSGVANCIISFANVVVQSNINAFGAAAMAGCGAHSRIEGFAFLPVTCFNMALTTFVSQNLGANRPDRAKKGIRIGILCSAGIAETVALIICCFSPQLIGLFDSNPEVIAYGVMHQRTITPFFFLAAYTHAIAASLRGAGKSSVAMLGMAICWCVIRVPYVTIATQYRPVLTTVSWAYPITWLLSCVFFTIYYFKADWMGQKHAPRL